MSGKSSILILDFGSSFSGVLVRTLRSIGIYSRLYPVEDAINAFMDIKPSGVILCGGLDSVAAPDALKLDPEFIKLSVGSSVPILAISYGISALLQAMGAKLERSGITEYKVDEFEVLLNSDKLFDGVPSKFKSLCNHIDFLVQLPDGFVTLGKTANSNCAGVYSHAMNVRGVCFHPESEETEFGTLILRNFAYRICECELWSVELYYEEVKKSILSQSGSGKYVIGGLSGGVDSTVCAALLHRLIRDRFHGLMIDTGLMRHGETRACFERLRHEIPDISLTIRDSSKVFFSALKGITDPEEKRKVIGRVYIEEFERAMEEMGFNHSNCLLLQGTIYPDILESQLNRKSKMPIKSHHNVGGLPSNMKFELIEPVRYLFKQEVRDLGRLLGLSEETFSRQPFPGPGLGVRVIGELTPGNVEIARKADRILNEEIDKHDYRDKISQCACIILPTVHSTGITNGDRTYGHVAILRIVSTVDFVTAKWARNIGPEHLAEISNRITSEVPQITRVCYDITDKPPATIEWQ